MTTLIQTRLSVRAILRPLKQVDDFLDWTRCCWRLEKSTIEHEEHDDDERYCSVQY